MKFRICLFVVLSLALFAGARSKAAAKPPDYISSAVADPSRPADDRGQDVNRHPEEVIAFSDVKPGARKGLQTAAALAIPEPADLIFTSMNYHDLHDSFLGSPDMGAFNRTLFNALKPRGIFLVVDHVAAAGAGFTKTDDLHRVDPAAVKAEVSAAGFEFVGESKVLYNAADDHSSSIYDKTIRGKTDRFVYKFRRPRS